MKRVQTIVTVILALTCGAVSAQRLRTDNEKQDCATGIAAQRLQESTQACRTAHDAAVRARQFEQALRHALTGCEKYRDDQSCRNVASLPRVIASHDQRIAPDFVREVERLGYGICVHGMQVSTAASGNSRGSLCAYFAHQFELAAYYQELNGLPANALKYLHEMLYEPELALLMYQAACEILGHGESCGAAEGLDVRLEPRRGAQRHASADATLGQFRRVLTEMRTIDTDEAQYGADMANFRGGNVAVRAANFK